MASGRLLSSEAGLDEDLNACSLAAMLLYVLTVAHLDRDGLIDGTPAVLAARVAPLRADLRDAAGSLINEWVDQGLVVRYPGTRGNRSVLFFKGFRRHQTNLDYSKEKPSVFPPPPGYTRGKNGLIPEDSGACFRLAEALRMNSHYRAELITVGHGTATGLTPDVYGTISRSSPAELPVNRTEQNRNETTNVEEGDRSSIHLSTPRYGAVGGVWGGVIGRLTREQLTAVCMSLGEQLGFGRTWATLRRDLADATVEQLQYLLAWMWYASTMDADEIERLNSVAGFVRARAGFKRGGGEPVAPPVIAGHEAGEVAALVARVLAWEEVISA